MRSALYKKYFKSILDHKKRDLPEDISEACVWKVECILSFLGYVGFRLAEIMGRI